MWQPSCSKTNWMPRPVLYGMDSRLSAALGTYNTSWRMMSVEETFSSTLPTATADPVEPLAKVTGMGLSSSVTANILPMSGVM